MNAIPTQGDKSNEEIATASKRLPVWLRWYFALAALNVITLCASLALNYWQSEQRNVAIQTHGIYARLLEQAGEVRTLAIDVVAPANDIFVSHDLAGESHRLEVNVAVFQKGFDRLRILAASQLDAQSRVEVETHLPAIEGALDTTVTEARRVFSFDQMGKPSVAGEHMAAMNAAYGAMLLHLMQMELVVRRFQNHLLTQQRAQADGVERYGIALFLAAITMAIGAAIHGHRVYRATRKERLVRERSTRDLTRARDQAEEAAKIKTRFLANMSHEIRTPMNGVLGMLDALSSTRLDAEQARIVKTASASADLLLSIIDDILDVSKIEAGMLVIERMPVDVEAIVQHVVSLYTVRTEEKAIDLRCELSAQLPARVVSDPTRLTQVLSNFVSNAIKFTERGEVTISVSVLDRDNDNVQLRFAVKDSGIGIAKEAQQRLFNAFTQADNSTSRRFGGTGLGLAICRQIVDLLDPEYGEIGVVSNEGEGSEFYFSMRMPIAHADAEPLKIAREADRPTADQSVAQKRFSGKVLIAEDNDTNRQVAITMLRRLGIEPQIACDGREALAAAQRERFDLILMDYHMPNLDGCEATAAIRDYERAHDLSRSPIVAVTASVLSEDKQRCNQVGMDGFLAKPIRQHALSTVLEKWLPSEMAAAPIAATFAASDDLPQELFDIAQFNEMREITGEAFAGLVKQFQSNVHTGVHAMRAACEVLDVAELKRAAHKLKGSSATLGLIQIAAQCLRLEMLGNSTSVEGAPAMIAALVQAYLRAKPYLDDCSAVQQDIAAGY